jgi:hypothetical protein
MPVTFSFRISLFLDALAWYLFSRNGLPVDPSPILLVSFRGSYDARAARNLSTTAWFRELAAGPTRPKDAGARRQPAQRRLHDRTDETTHWRMSRWTRSRQLGLLPCSFAVLKTLT